MINNKFAGFWHRALAYVIDCLIWSVLTLSFLLFAATSSSIAELSFRGFLMLLFIFSPLCILYTILPIYYFGGTIGLLACGLRVVDEDSKRLSFKRVLFRQTIGMLFSGVFFGLGYLAVATDKKHQGWHDQAAHSFVIVRQPIWIVGVLIALLLLFSTIFSVGAVFAEFPKSQAIKDIIRSVNPQQKMIQEDKRKASEKNGSQGITHNL